MHTLNPSIDLPFKYFGIPFYDSNDALNAGMSLDSFGDNKYF